MDLPARSALIEHDLAVREAHYPRNAVSHGAFRRYQEFLDHDELELARVSLELSPETTLSAETFGLRSAMQLQ